MIFYIFSFIVASLIFIISFKIFKNRGYWEKRGVKGYPSTLINAFLYRRGTPISELELEIYFKFLKDDKYGGLNDAVQGLSFYLKDLDIIKKILVKDFDHFMNRGFSSKTTPDDFSTLMLNLQSGQHWKNLRSTISPIFTTGKIKRLFSTFDKCGDNLEEFLLKTINEKGEIMDIQNALQRYTMSVIASAVFAIDSQAFLSIDEDPYFVKMAKRYTNLSLGTLLKIFSLFAFPFLTKIFKAQMMDSTANQYFEKVVLDAIRHRENMGKDEKYNDFLQFMLETRKGETGGNTAEEAEKMDKFEKDAELNTKAKVELSDNYIIAQCILFLFAGFDTTETLLTWASYELALNPEIQDKLRSEIEKAEQNEGQLDYQKVIQIDYLDKFISETLRKYPPATRLDRKCVSDYTIEGTDLVIEKNVLVQIPIYAFHHDPKYFPNPEKFDPNRFDTEEKEKRHPYAYMPFGHGPRNCIGMRFALLEAKALLIHLVRKFKIEPTSETSVPPKYTHQSFFLKPANGMKLKFSEIN